MVLREPHEVAPAPRTREQILAHGIAELSMLATGSHIGDPCYVVRREIKEYALRIQRAAALADAEQRVD
jgi:hypothetical protein